MLIDYFNIDRSGLPLGHSKHILHWSLDADAVLALAIPLESFETVPR